jgi:hypothetical protein
MNINVEEFSNHDLWISKNLLRRGESSYDSGNEANVSSIFTGREKLPN